jgi:hypothetical protein
MSRVINTDGPGKKRNFHMRTAAELLRRLSQKSEIDDDARDMLAELVFTLREIDQGIDDSARAWEKRDYWMKAEEFRQKWGWAGRMADDVYSILISSDWARLPVLMTKLLPYFADIKITKYMRKESMWLGSYERLMSERSQNERG